MHFLLENLRGLIVWSIMVTHLIIAAICFFPLALLKLLSPSRRLRKFWTRGLEWIFQKWGRSMHWLMNTLCGLEWELQLPDDLSPEQTCIALANHTSTVDILDNIQIISMHGAPIRFFLKRMLLLVPIIGAACWALDFPFMRRHSKAYLERHPEKRGQDRDEARRACERYHDLKVSILIYAEGTRFSIPQWEASGKPFEYLLPPKAGGFAAALDAMDETLECIIDITQIIYGPTRKVSLWDCLCGRVDKVIYHMRKLPVPRQLLGGDYDNDPEFRQALQQWLQALWREKDARIARITAEHGPLPCV